MKIFKIVAEVVGAPLEEVEQVGKGKDGWIIFQQCRPDAWAALHKAGRCMFGKPHLELCNLGTHPKVQDLLSKLYEDVSVSSQPHDRALCLAQHSRGLGPPSLHNICILAALV